MLFLDYIYEILNQWSISPVVEYSQINSRVYEINCSDKKRYILKSRPNNYKLKSEYYILKHLSINNIPVPLPLLTKSGNFFAIKEGKGYTLYEYLLGEPIEYNLDEDHKNLSYIYGEILGKYHYNLNNYKGPLENISIFDQERRIINYTRDEINIKLPNNRANEIIDNTYNELKILCEKMPRQLIHKDVNLYNILFDNDNLSGIIDFDPIVLGYKVFDLSFLTLHLSGHIYNTDRLKKWVKIIPNIILGYKCKNSLDQIELNAIWFYLVLIEMYYAAFKFSVNSLDAENILNISYWIYDNKDDVINAIQE